MTKLTFMRAVLAGALVLGFLSALAALFFFAVPSSNKDIIIYMLGQLSGFVAAVVGVSYTKPKDDGDDDLGEKL